MLHAKSLGHCLQSLELDNIRIWKLFQDLLAILNVDISRTILIMIDSEAITWLWTLAAHTYHLGTNLGVTHVANVGIRRNDLAMRSHNDLGE